MPVYSDKMRLFSVGLPKTGSTTVGRAMALSDPGTVRVADIVDHAALGRIDQGHLSLDRMRRHFPELWRRFCDYFSFAVVRRPLERFPSAASEHLVLTGRSPLEMMDNFSARAALREVAETLRAVDPAEDWRLTHLQRQSSFVALDGGRPVSSVRPLGSLDLLWDDIRHATGVSLPSPGRENAASVRRGARKDAFPRLRRMARAALPRSLRRALMPRALRRADPASIVMEDASLRRFVEEYYAADVELFAEATARAETDARAARSSRGVAEQGA